jgi:hypothetical protein
MASISITSAAQRHACDHVVTLELSKTARWREVVKIDGTFPMSRR